MENVCATRAPSFHAVSAMFPSMLVWSIMSNWPKGRLFAREAWDTSHSAAVQLDVVHIGDQEPWCHGWIGRRKHRLRQYLLVECAASVQQSCRFAQYS